MLDSLPGLDRIILTFIETGVHVEDQHSEVWETDAEKLANLVDSVASVVIDEREMDVYIRTFIYYQEELDALLGCVNQVQHPKVKIMTKEVPHDFFLTHPVSTFIEMLNKDVLIEYDLGHEYNGQGVIASVLPEVTVDRWKYYAGKENVIGYVARINRNQNAININTPNEVNIYALKRIAEDTSLTTDVIVEEYIAQIYGQEAVPWLKQVFMETNDIITSILYTLSTHTDSHSRLSLEREAYYSRHCSGKWMDNPEVFVEHGVNKKFHYWKDTVEHLSRAEWKSKTNNDGGKTMLYLEALWIIEEKL